jgi:hypothetical protein
MSTKKVFEDSKVVIYETVDDTFLVGTGAKKYKAVDKKTGAEASGKSVAEARGNLEQGMGR